MPPLLYADSWALSLKELWKWRRIIFSFAFIVVFITAAAVAWVANMVLPGFSLALGFLFGGVVGSTDVVSVSAILKFVKVPHRLSTILENESLLNDASSLIVFRFAALVVTTGQFVWYQMAGGFLWVVIGGVAVGLAVAYLLRLVHKLFPTDANMDIILTFISPYIMYMIANALEASGVLAVVAGGAYLNHFRNEIFPAATRNKAMAVWDNIGVLAHWPESARNSLKHQAGRNGTDHRHLLWATYGRGNYRSTYPVRLWGCTHHSNHEALYPCSRRT